MSNRNYEKGAALERAWCADKQRDGWITGRIAGSKGAFDAFAARDGELQLAQMKAGGTSTYSGFGPSAREQLAQAAAIAGGRAVLVRKRSRQRGYTEHYEDEWPELPVNGGFDVYPENP